MLLSDSASLNYSSSGSLKEFAEYNQQEKLIEQLLAIGTALSVTQDLGELLNLILTQSREITSSDAGSVYLLDRSDAIPKLLFKVAQNDSKPNLSFREFAIPITPQSLAGYVALTGESLNLPDAYDLSEDVCYQIDRHFDSDVSYRTRSVLVLPMQNQEGEIIGVLQLINRKVRPDVLITPENALQVTQPYTEREERLVRSLASQAAISIERNDLQHSIENLFEGFVKASVQIIETRDPTTSGHSERVAELTVRLSQEVHSIDAGPLRWINFSDRQIKEIRYAALLHDFGKVGVPEAILGKSKKLYPEQLEILRHRFALAERTLEMECAHNKINYLLGIPHHPHDDSANEKCSHCDRLQHLDAKLAQALEKLNHYWELVLEVNEPEAIQTKEFQAFSEEALGDLTELSQYSYRDINGQLKPLITQAEMAQLMVPRGNLTQSERLQIESHVTHTYEFLKQIPWTKHLKSVPLIAAAHHEKLDGSGYPQGLKQQDIPIPSQIMAIADIYDALTASDRPYKRRLSVETSLKILRQEASKNKLNSDLVDLFDRRQVFSILGHVLASDD